jgi:release factor glutamine methyltransferase
MEMEGKKMPTPELGHLTAADFERVYEPAHDTFLFLDALQQDESFLRARQPLICLEVGFVPPPLLPLGSACSSPVRSSRVGDWRGVTHRSGSGCVVSFLAKEVLRGLPTVFFATDLNHHAAAATASTARANDVPWPTPRSTYLNRRCG